jgi:hypothetical protein
MYSDTRAHLKTPARTCINQGTNFVPEDPSNLGSKVQPRSATLIAASLLLAALAVVVLYTERGAFLSPVALVVIAAIGVAALLLQLRLRPDLSSSVRGSARGPLWLNVVGVIFAAGALFADVLHLSATLLLIAALVAVVSFAVSGIIVLSALRKPRS